MPVLERHPNPIIIWFANGLNKNDLLQLSLSGLPPELVMQVREYLGSVVRDMTRTDVSVRFESISLVSSCLK